MLPYPVLPVLMQLQAMCILVEAQRLLLNEFLSYAISFQSIVEASSNVVETMAALSPRAPSAIQPQLKIVALDD